MEYYSNEITKLIEEFAALPGIGAKSAQRLAFHVLDMTEEQAQSLASAIVRAKHNIKYCKCCFTLTDQEKFPICSKCTFQCIQTHNMLILSHYLANCK